MAWNAANPTNDELLSNFPAQCRANWDAIALGTDANLLITNAKVAAGAGIEDTKLAQITTAGKVSGAALISLSSTPSGAGILPDANSNGKLKADSSDTTPQYLDSLIDTDTFQVSAGDLLELKDDGVETEKLENGSTTPNDDTYYGANTSGTIGFHDRLTMPLIKFTEGTAPATAAGQMALYAKDTDGQPELFCREESSGDEVQLTKGGRAGGVVSFNSSESAVLSTSLTSNAWTDSGLTAVTFTPALATNLIQVEWGIVANGENNRSFQATVDIGGTKKETYLRSTVSNTGAGSIDTGVGGSFTIQLEASSQTFKIYVKYPDESGTFTITDAYLHITEFSYS